jgi:hypothetical protein
VTTEDHSHANDRAGEKWTNFDLVFGRMSRDEANDCALIFRGSGLRLIRPLFQYVLLQSRTQKRRLGNKNG